MSQLMLIKKTSGMNIFRLSVSSSSDSKGFDKITNIDLSSVAKLFKHLQAQTGKESRGMRSDQAGTGVSPEPDTVCPPCPESERCGC